MKNTKGKNLERRINRANYRYRKEGTAMIKKEEVPILITATKLQPTLSTVDYTGSLTIWYKDNKKVGLFIAFDAKECASKTSFPLKNIHQHQLEFLKAHQQLGSKTFFLIHFTSLHIDEAFLVPIDFIDAAWTAAEQGGSKSIKYEKFNKDWLVPIDNYLINLINKSCENLLDATYK